MINADLLARARQRNMPYGHLELIDKLATALAASEARFKDLERVSDQAVRAAEEREREVQQALSDALEMVSKQIAINAGMREALAKYSASPRVEAAAVPLIARLAAKDKINEVLRGALEDLFVAVNPDDRISMATWNERLKAATIVARTALLLAEAERSDA